MEEIELYLKGREEPIKFKGKYIGQKFPYGKETTNWHFYERDDGRFVLVRKKHLQMVITEERNIQVE